MAAQPLGDHLARAVDDRRLDGISARSGVDTDVLDDPGGLAVSSAAPGRSGSSPLRSCATHWRRFSALISSGGRASSVEQFSHEPHGGSMAVSPGIPNRPTETGSAFTCTSSSPGAGGSDRSWPRTSNGSATPSRSSTRTGKHSSGFDTDFKGKQVVGFVFDRDILEEAGIKEADAFASVTNGDNSNIVSARMAKEHYRVPQVVARIYDPRRAQIYQRLGIQTVATVRWTTDQILRFLLPEDVPVEYTMDNGEVVVTAVPAPQRDRGRKALRHRSRRSTATLMAVSRFGVPRVPDEAWRSRRATPPHLRGPGRRGGSRRRPQDTGSRSTRP